MDNLYLLLVHIRCDFLVILTFPYRIEDGSLNFKITVYIVDVFLYFVVNISVLKRHESSI